VTPERRHIEQIAFPSMEAAEQASQRIAHGTSFEKSQKSWARPKKTSIWVP